MKTIFSLTCLVTILLLTPLIGALLAGGTLDAYLEFPPRSPEPGEASYSPSAWWGLVLFTLVLAGLWTYFQKKNRATQDSLGPRNAPRPGFPMWGIAGVVFLLASWMLAWTRFEWMEPLQAYTFVPLWFGYIWVVNALLFSRSGRSPLTHSPGLFFLLFPCSALFWWVFEYLNRFPQNWSYVSVEMFSPLEYLLHASLAFSMVLPAVYSTYLLLRALPGMERFFIAGPVLRIHYTSPVRLAMGSAGILLLAGLGFYPRIFFPVLWIAPLLLLAAWPRPETRFPFFKQLREGDWRWIASWALAALICGFFWELWNVYSYAAWTYTIPFFHRLEIFEMPLLGYLGYLPFGLQIGLVIHFTMDARSDQASPFSNSFPATENGQRRH